MINGVEMVDQLIVQVNELLDARGVEKCRLALDIIQRLAALRNGLAEEEKVRRSEHVETNPR